jgi:subtilisin family serine protease
MRFTPTRAAVAVALACGIFTSSSYAVRPAGVAEEATEIKPALMPAGLSLQPVTVVLEMAGESVAEQQGNAGRRLDRAEKQRAKDGLKGQQEAIRGHIEGRGGRVLATYQAAYNGMKVRISRDRVSELAALPGVVAVRPVMLHKPNNVHGVPLVGAPAVWDGLRGLRGDGVKVAIIDTGIDYTHATFGGPGTASAFATAAAHSTESADPALFGPGAPRIKGGIDLVGDDYDASAPAGSPKLTPHPDLNPLDCNGHGSHVAGTAAGSGVTAGGATYTGPYNEHTLDNASNFRVGPGVAPKADLYAVRVFGCEGSTDVVVEALEWAVDNDMDVVNMSLGSSFGAKDSADAIAANNAAKAGVIVVASAGNSGGNPYITGSPATADGAISVAANDPTPQFAGAIIGLPTANVQSIDANGAALPAGSHPIRVLKNADGSLSRGCNPAEYTGGGGSTGMIVVVVRGTCARVARAIYGQKAGAVGVVMVNTSDTYPPAEGTITSNPDTGEAYLVTIPFLGVKSSSRATMTAADGAPATLTGNTIPNPTFEAFADFTSGGPRTGDGHLKPDVTAPGVSIVSTGIGTGNGPATFSGTSMAAPHTTGVAALTRQARPAWRVEDIKSAIVHTGQPAGVANYKTSRGGTGLVQAASSTMTDVVARTSGAKFGAALNFGVAEFRDPYSRTLEISLRNRGRSSASFTVAATRPQGSPHSITLNRSAVTVRPGDDAEVRVTLNVDPATAGAANESALSYQEVAGLIEFTPQSPADNAGVALRVPYLLVPRVRSEVSTKLGRFSQGSATATVTNKNGAIPGDADFYAWGLSAKKSNNKTNETADIRAVGVQSFPLSASQAIIVFAVNTYDRWSSPSSNRFDISVDVNGDGTDDYVVIGVDDGAVTTGRFNGRLRPFVLDLRTGILTLNNFLAIAPTDGSTALIPVLASQLCRPGSPCLSQANPRITYSAVGLDLLNGGFKAVPGVAKYNVWASSISQGDFLTVAPGANATTTISVNGAEALQTPALGVMVVTLDNKSGGDEADLLQVK